MSPLSRTWIMARPHWLIRCSKQEIFSALTKKWVLKFWIAMIWKENEASLFCRKMFQSTTTVTKSTL